MSVRVCAPGRVNLLGEHVDYNGGFVLPAAIDRFLSLKADPAPDDVFTLRALDLNQQVSFRAENLDRKIDLDGNALPDWALYPAGVCWSLIRHGYTPRAVLAEYCSHIPAGAGLSSSAAVETAFGLLWQTLGGWQMNRMELARICLMAETHYVGVNCGIMDQFACLHGQAGHVLFLDTQTLEWEPIPLSGVTLVVARTGKSHQLGLPAGGASQESQYNQRRSESDQAFRLLKDRLPGIKSLRDVSLDQFNRLETELPELLRRRARHVIEECSRVLTAVECLRIRDYEQFGRQMFAGHVSLRDLYEVSSPELDRLVQIAVTLPGCFGARLTGAGFGGSTINLVREDAAASFIHSLIEEHHRQTGQQVDIFPVHIAGGAQVI